jgi:hypothetical protein
MNLKSIIAILAVAGAPVCAQAQNPTPAKVTKADAQMSAIGPKRTSLVAPHMSAFGGKADMTVCANPLSRSLLGQSGHDVLRRTCLLMTQSGHWTTVQLDFRGGK